MRNRVSLPFREVEADPVPLAGVRASPSGRYLLVLFRWAGAGTGLRGKAGNLKGVWCSSHLFWPSLACWCACLVYGCMHRGSCGCHH